MPYYQQDDIELHHLDAVEFMDSLQADSIDLTVTSPPYDPTVYDESGNLITFPGKGLRDYQDNYKWDFASIARGLWRVTKPGGVVVWVVGDATIDGSETGSSFRQALFFMGLGFRLHDTMFWNKISPYQHDNRYIQSVEYMFILSKLAPKTVNLIKDRKNIHAGVKMHGTERQANGKTKPLSDVQKSKNVKEYGSRYNIWDIPNEKNNQTDHPAPFPEALARDHLKSWSNPGDLVMDIFTGSGTTAKMCKLLGRKFKGCEVSAEYLDIAINRIGQPLLFDYPEKVEKPEELKQGGFEL